MAKIIYVRHGESTNNILSKGLSNILDPDLTEKGILQAQTSGTHLLNRIKKLNILHVNILSSPLCRTDSTASYFIGLLKEQSKITYSIEINLDIREYTGKHKVIPPYLENIGVVHDKNWLHFVNRVVTFNEYLKNKVIGNDNKLTVLFGHGLFFSVLISYQSIQEMYYGSQHIGIELDNCSFTELEYNEKGPQFWKFNSIGNTNHLFDIEK